MQKGWLIRNRLLYVKIDKYHMYIIVGTSSLYLFTWLTILISHNYLSCHTIWLSQNNQLFYITCYIGCQANDIVWQLLVKYNSKLDHCTTKSENRYFIITRFCLHVHVYFRKKELGSNSLRKPISSQSNKLFGIYTQGLH